jgi:ABC-type glycerol-3-phosphate transport system substrate-binding protein
VTPMVERSTRSLALLAVLAVVAAGCGGSSDTKANEAYANSVCTAIGNWEQEIKSIATSFSGGVSQSSLQTSITQAEAATKTLVTQIKAVPPPDTSQGQAAKQQLDQLTTDINNTIDAAQTAVTQIQANPSAAGISAMVATLAPQVQSLASETNSAISSLKGAGGSLASAFKSTDSCKSLGGS